MDFFHPLQHRVIILITTTSFIDEIRFNNYSACAQDQHVTGLILKEFKNYNPTIVWCRISIGDMLVLKNSIYLRWHMQLGRVENKL